jgi:diguanylate cyclase (GGDEF) domain
MISYLTQSFRKFKQDSLSKLFYDVAKYLLLGLLVFAGTKLLPVDTSLGKVISTQFSISLYSFILILLFVVIISVILLKVIFDTKYRALQKDNFTDELTGLKNHKALKNYLNNKLLEPRQSVKTLSLILIDIDNFKIFNDSEGYNTSDKILAKVGELLGNDKRITDEVFRQFLRGDEFLIVTEDTNLTEAFHASERKRKLIENTTFMVDDKSFRLTVSCGVTEFKKDTDTYESITDRVNSALLIAKKQSGKNCSKTIV